MDLSTTLFNKPKLRAGVSARVEGHSIDVNYRNQGCDIYCEEIEPQLLNQFLTHLKNGELTIEQLKQIFADFSESIEEFLIEFDRLGLLEEGELPQVTGVLSGKDFYYSRLLPTIKKVQYELGDSAFFERLLSKKVTKNELIGFALEYYHLVKMSPGLISPSLSHTTNEAIRAQLLKLFVEEYDHDKMMIACLKSVGLEEENILNRQPLPTSFSAYASLGVYARQHLLSFFSALMLFETPSHEFNRVFVKTCEEMGVTPDFYRPLVKHSEINEEEKHDEISLNLLSQVPLISEEEQNTILIHITAMVEMLHKQDQQIVEYYSDANCDLLRVFA